MTRAHKLFLKWLLQFSLMAFFIFFIFDQGLIFKIISSDKSYITSLILVLFIIISMHCFYHTFIISDELNKAHVIKKSLLDENVKLRIIEDVLILTSKGEVSSGIVRDYFKDLIGLKKMEQHLTFKYLKVILKKQWVFMNLDGFAQILC